MLCVPLWATRPNPLLAWIAALHLVPCCGGAMPASGPATRARPAAQSHRPAPENSRKLLLGRLHAAPANDGCGRRRGEIGDERPCRWRLDRTRRNAGSEHGRVLDRGRQRPREIDARYRQQLAHLLEADFGLPACYHGADGLAFDLL